MKYLHNLYSETRLLVIFFIFALFVVLFPLKAFAQSYGSGSYGCGDYGTGNNCSSSSQSSNNNSVGGGNGSASAPVCGNTPPANTPQWLYAAIPQNGTSVMLYFTDASGSYDHYVVEYGLGAGKYTFGLDNAGGKGTRAVVINNLMPNATYYFRVRAGNGCATGPWSNELSTKTQQIVSTNNLAFTSTQVIPVQDTTQGNTQPQQQNSCKTYTVKSGDTLYAIAQNLLGDGNNYQQLIDQNKITYPSLSTSNSLRIGWQLQVSCQNGQTNQQQTTTQQSTAGYNVNVSVKDTKNQPISGATVTLHSTPQTAKTDKNGVATFHNIDKGQHQVLIAYNNYQGQENINLAGNVKTFNVAIQVKPINVLLSPLAYLIIGILVLVICILLFLLIKNKKRTRV